MGVDSCQTHSGMEREGPREVKLIVLGDANVGKTSLLLRYCEDDFSEQIATINVDYKQCAYERNGAKAQLAIWDTAGQERYRTITTSFYRDTDAVILVYDMTDPASFSGLDRWKEELEANVPFSQKILVGNKVDLEEHGRQVTLEEGQNWATKHGFLFMEASAKTNANVQELFAAVVDAVLLQGTGRTSIGRKKSVAVSLRKSTGSSNSRRNRFSSACRLL